MKKLLFIVATIFVVSCSNPEDKASSDSDSSRFNSNPDNNLNTTPGPTDPNSQTGVGSRDSSKALDTSIRTDTTMKRMK